MGYRAHAVKRKEEYADGAYFNWQKPELECLFKNLCDDFYGDYDESHRTEISVEDLEHVIANVTFDDIEEAELFSESGSSGEEKLAKLKQYLQEILDDADKENGYVEIVWF